MDNKNCGVCGKEIADRDGGHCAECKTDLKRKNRKRLMYSSVAVAILMLVGAIFLYGKENTWDYSWNSLLQRPAVVVNGEPIVWFEAKERFRITKLMMEKEYGKELFAGERGRAYLRDLERNVLERMIADRLVAQEARRLNIQVGDDRVKKEVQEIGREIYGNWDNFQASLREDGISEEYLSAHIRNLLLHQEVKKAKTPEGLNPDDYFNAWLTQDRQSAKVAFNKAIGSIEVSGQRQGSCCGTTDKRVSGTGCGGSGGGGCGGQKTAAGPLDPRLQSEAGAAALAAYQKTNPAEKDVAAKVTDYGCHVQVDIEKGGKIVRSYTYQNGTVIDNS